MKPLRCRVGDLCVVIHAAHPSNLGHIVRILSPYDPCGSEGCDIEMTDADWLVESAFPMTWSRGKHRRWRRKRGPVPDEYLQPLRGGTPGQMALWAVARPRGRLLHQ